MMVGSAEKDIAKIQVDLYWLLMPILKSFSQAGKPENTPEIIDDFDDNVVEEAVTVRIEKPD